MAAMSAASARELIQEAERAKASLEAEAEAIAVELDAPVAETGAPGPGLKGPLVDAEGYPRADVDLYRVRTLRGRHATIRTDHKARRSASAKRSRGDAAAAASWILRTSRGAPPRPRAGILRDERAVCAQDLMKKIEALLPLALAPTADDEDATMADGPWAAATIPASEPATPTPPEAPPAGAPFCGVVEVRGGSPAAAAGLRVGDRVVKFGDATALSDVKRFVLSNVGEPFGVWVRRDSGLLRVALTPQAWAGEGLLGCRLVPDSGAES